VIWLTSFENRTLFLKYDVHQKVAICVVHRHFDLAENEKLVQFNSVIAPWCVDDSPDYLIPGIRAKNWAFLNDGALFPYEFRFTPHPDPTASTHENEMPFPLSFSNELYDTMVTYGLQDVYGLVAVEPDDVDPTTPTKLEFTAGRTSVLVPMTPEMESMARVEAAWVFPCATPFTGPFGPDGLIKTRFCALACRGHSDPDPGGP